MSPCNFRFSKVNNGFFIPVIGAIATGKSCFTTALGEVIREEEGECKCFYEPAAKEDGEASVFLPRFYDPNGGQERWGFTVQVEMLTRRFKQHKLAQALSRDGVSSVADSAIWSDGVFVNLLEKDGKMDHDEADLYYDLFAEMCGSLMYPTAIIYLSVTPEKALERLNKRMSEKEGRKMESNIPLSYLAGLIGEYNELVTHLRGFCHVLTIDWMQDKTPDQIKDSARDIFHTIKDLRQRCPIGCQIGL